MINKFLKLTASTAGVLIALPLVVAAGMLAGMLALALTVVRRVRPERERLPQRRARPRPVAARPAAAESAPALAGEGSAA
jgi:Flp pilus assembly protein protease CpaA